MHQTDDKIKHSKVNPSWSKDLDRWYGHYLAIS